MKGSAPGSASEAGLLWRSSGTHPFSNENTGREQIFKQDGISSDRVCQKDKGTGSASGKRPEYDAGNLDLPLQTLRSSSLMDVSVRGAVIEEAVTSLVREELKTESDAGKAALLLTSVFEMGLDQEMEPVYEAVSRIILEDTRFLQWQRHCHACGC